MAKQETPAAAKPDARKYCIYTQVTGSRIEKLECRTRASWIADRDIDPVELQKQR